MLIILLIKKLLKLSVMNNIPDLGDFGYISSPSSEKGINWLSIIILAAIGIVVVFLAYNFLQMLTANNEDTNQIEEVLKSNEYLELKP